MKQLLRTFVTLIAPAFLMGASCCLADDLGGGSHELDSSSQAGQAMVGLSVYDPDVGRTLVSYLYGTDEKKVHLENPLNKTIDVLVDPNGGNDTAFLHGRSLYPSAPQVVGTPVPWLNLPTHGNIPVIPGMDVGLADYRALDLKESHAFMSWDPLGFKDSQNPYQFVTTPEHNACSSSDARGLEGELCRPLSTQDYIAEMFKDSPQPRMTVGEFLRRVPDEPELMLEALQALPGLVCDFCQNTYDNVIIFFGEDPRLYSGYQDWTAFLQNAGIRPPDDPGIVNYGDPLSETLGTCAAYTSSACAAAATGGAAGWGQAAREAAFDVGSNLTGVPVFSPRRRATTCNKGRCLLNLAPVVGKPPYRGHLPIIPNQPGRVSVMDPNTKLRPGEVDFYEYLAKRGDDIVAISPNAARGIKRPDCYRNNILTEVKQLKQQDMNYFEARLNKGIQQFRETDLGFSGDAYLLFDSRSCPQNIDDLASALVRASKNDPFIRIVVEVALPENQHVTLIAQGGKLRLY